jgi:hypothetical protein
MTTILNFYEMLTSKNFSTLRKKTISNVFICKTNIRFKNYVVLL